MGSDVDILVIGAGACGLAAAIAGHDAGASVAIIEKQDRPGGNSSLSTGSVPAAGSRYQREAGIEDDPERMVRDLMGIARQTDGLELVPRLAGVSAETVEWLVDDVGARIALVTAYKHIGHRCRGCTRPCRGAARISSTTCLRPSKSATSRSRSATAPSALIVEDGAVAGRDRRDRRHAERDPRRARSSSRSTAMPAIRDSSRASAPRSPAPQYFGARGSTGEAVLWGEALGAGLAQYGAYQGYAAVADPHGSLLSWTTIEKGGIHDRRRCASASATRAWDIPAIRRMCWRRASPAMRSSTRRSSTSPQREEEFVELVEIRRLEARRDTRRRSRRFSGSKRRPLADERRRLQPGGARGEPRMRSAARDFGLAPLTGPSTSAASCRGSFTRRAA